MAYEFNLPIDEIIEEAYDLVGQTQIGSENMRTAKRSLNLLFIELRNKNIPMCNLEKVSIPMIQGQAEYTLDEKVLDIMNAVIKRDDVDIPMVRMSLFDYQNQPAKTQQGRAIVYSVDRQKDAPIISVWPTSENSTDTMEVWAFRKNADVDNYTDFVDIATKYIPAMTIGLASKLALKNTKMTVEERLAMSNKLESQYEMKLTEAFEEDRERISVFFTPTPRKGY